VTLKVKRIKRSALEDLGDGFDILTAEETVEAGFTLADDEVIVVEKPEPVEPPEGEAVDVTELKAALHKANQESATRRIALRENKDKISALESENATLKSNEQAHKTKEKKDKAADLFKALVTEKKVAFITDAAGIDAQEEIFASVDWTHEVTKEILAPLFDAHTQKKPYILKTAALGRTDGGTQGSGNTEGLVDIDLEEVARTFNLPAPKKEGAT